MVAKAAKLDQIRLLQWVLAYPGLSATWKLAAGINPRPNMMISEIASAGLA
jgi:streptomycin 6-kinase